MRKRVIVIGSGLGGLSVGVMLARNGYDVTVVEQEAVIGGCLQCFYRSGARFETGLHYVGSADPGQQLYRVLQWLEVLDGITLDRLDTDGYNVISMGGNRFSIPNGREAFIERMGEYFPSEKDCAARYYDTVTEIAGSSQFYDFDTSRVFRPDGPGTMAMNTVMDSLVRDPLMRDVLCGDQPLYAARRNITPFLTHALIFNFYNSSAFRIAGGGGTLASALRGTLERYGGRVISRFRVSRIICGGGLCRGVEADDGRRLDGDFVISSVHPVRTLEMLDARLLRPAYRRRIASLPNTVSCFAVYLRFRDGACPYLNANYFGYTGNSPWGSEDYDSKSWPGSYMYMHHCDVPGMTHARTGVVLAYMWMRDVEQWSGTVTGHRPQQYLDFKRRAAARLMAVVERDFPGLGAAVQDYWTSTPLTYRDYTGTVGGSMYGIEKNITAGAAGRVSHRTRIPNLFLCGQSINSHGTLGVLVGSMICAAELLGMENIFKQIRSQQ